MRHYILTAAQLPCQYYTPWEGNKLFSLAKTAPFLSASNFLWTKDGGASNILIGFSLYIFDPFLTSASAILFVSQ